jgi:hypothetical protein
MREMEILNELSQIAFGAARGEYDELRLEIEIEDHWIEAAFWQTANGATKSLRTLEGVHDPSLMELSYGLQEAIKNQNGGDLKKYSLRINKGGRATVDYEYRDGPE